MKLLVSALEPSANYHLEFLLKELGSVGIAGIFDRKLGEPLYGMEEFSVMGFVDVLGKYFKGKEAVAEMTQLAGECDKVLLIDAPAFNLPLAESIKKRYPDKEIVYYILPKVWAWKKGRAAKVDRWCDRLASIFPFEDRFYPRAEYVGNPLLDEITLRWEPTKDVETVAFLPGSRKSEITRLMPVFKEVADALPGRRKVLSIPAFISDDKIGAWYGDISGFDVVRDAQHAVAQAHFAFVCSGTATLETALIGTPFVLVYKARPLDWAIGNALVKLPYKGLANIVMDFAGREPVHPEIFQDDVTKEKLLALYETMDRGHFAQKSEELKALLGHGSAAKVAEMLYN
ncbi:lipid-A-disaccharide synthase [Hydrogenimonas sp.]